MQKGYSQFSAMLAITKASLRSILRSPSAVVFSIAFPMVFILVFGFLGNGGKVSVSVAFAPGCDTANPVYAALKQVAGLKLVAKDPQLVKVELEKGRITALINIQASGQANAPYSISLTSSEAVQPQNIEVLQSILNAVIAQINHSNYPNNPT
ncbi:MAG: ABC transporter permease, partial [Sediminibacterium sp.]|nr:ABC transporter permease [Sediminibacterium sp.]